MVAVNDGQPLYIELPASVELTVEYTEPGLQGDRSSGGTKPARLETGKEIQVPLFITSGEKVKVDTRDGSYLGRVSSLMSPAPSPASAPSTSSSSPSCRASRPAVRWRGAVELNDPPVNEYTVQLVEGVVADQERIDAMLAEHARGWTLDRMPGVDRNLLRIATYEILSVDDVPDAVAISEAVELARELSTDESPGFVNGLLSAIVQSKADATPGELRASAHTGEANQIVRCVHSPGPRRLPEHTSNASWCGPSLS